MNITLSAEEALIKKARECARQEGVSLNGFIRGQLRRLVEGGGKAAADEFLALATTHSGRSAKGFRFDREEAHRR